MNDTRGPRVAQIKRLWRTPSGVLFFRGPVFVRPEETVHEPVRNFHFKELIATQNEQNVPLSQIRGRCCVLVKTDYQSCRPVTITEAHIFYQESKYIESDGQNGNGPILRKNRTHKRYQPTNKDWFFFISRNSLILKIIDALNELKRRLLMMNIFILKRNRFHYYQPRHHDWIQWSKMRFENDQWKLKA